MCVFMICDREKRDGVPTTREELEATSLALNVSGEVADTECAWMMAVYPGDHRRNSRADGR